MASEYELNRLSSPKKASFVDDSGTIETSDEICVNIKSGAAAELGSVAAARPVAQQQVSVAFNYKAQKSVAA